MSRPPRVLSETGLYHIIFRGLNRQNLFEEDEDYIKLLEIINDIKTVVGIQIYAYSHLGTYIFWRNKKTDLKGQFV